MDPDTFSIDAADRLGGPDWLREAPVASATLGAQTSMPTAEAEEALQPHR